MTFLRLRLVPFSYGQSFAAVLRTRRSSFHHLQLLSTPAVSWNTARAAPFCEDTGPGSLAISRFRFLLIGYVVMPEHVHLLVSEPKKGNLSKVLQVLKQKVSRSLRKPARKPSAQLSLAFAATTDSPAFWQRRFYDFNVWSERKVREKLDYMHRNPVQRKLVSHPQGLAVEQLVALRKRRGRSDSHRHAGRRKEPREFGEAKKSKTAPLKNKGCGTLYDDVGFVKRHVDCARREGSFFSYLKESFLFPAFRPRLAS